MSVDLKQGRVWASYALAFISSACILVLELVAGRMLAPYVGVSLYTWTSIIGVVLAGISVGNYLGGRLADRFPYRQTLGLLLLASGFASLAVLVLLQWAPDLANTASLPLVARIVVLTAVLFFLPSCLMGMVSPMVVKLTLRDLSHAGHVVGKIYAFGTLGSILATFATGFVLISWFGTRTIVMGVAGLLVLLALLFGDLWRLRLPGVALVALFVGLSYAVWQQGFLASECLRETNYYCIRVYDSPGANGRTVRSLALDHLVHSFNSLEDPTYLHYGYLRVYEDVTAYVASSEPAFRALFLGGGGYTLPRALEVRYPQSRLEVIEIDPEVTAVAYQEMGLPRDTRVVTYNHDGRLMVDELLRAGQRYHLIFGDAFNDLSVPYHLTTREFAEKVRGLLVDDGFYLVNVIDHLQEGQFIRAFARTLGEVFPHVYIMYEGAPWESGGLSTYVVVASNRPIDQEALERGARRGGGDPVGTRIMPSERYRTWLAAVPAPVLTDEYAPVDNLIAPNFLRR